MIGFKSSNPRKFVVHSSAENSALSPLILSYEVWSLAEFMEKCAPENDEACVCVSEPVQCGCTKAKEKSHWHAKPIVERERERDGARNKWQEMFPRLQPMGN